MASTSARVDWHGNSPRPAYSPYDSPPSAYEMHQPPPQADMRSSYGYPPNHMMPSRGGGGPPPPQAPSDSSYWYEGHSTGGSHRRRPPSLHPPHPGPGGPGGPGPGPGPGWHQYGMHHEYESSYDHGMPPPPQHQQGYGYPYLPDMQHPPTHPSARRHQGGAHAPPPGMAMRGQPRPLQPRRGAGVGKPSGSYPPPASPKTRNPQDKGEQSKSTSKNKKNGKKGDPLSLLAKVSSAMVYDGKKKGGGSGRAKEGAEQGREGPGDHRGSAPTSPPQQSVVSRSQSQIITPVSKPPLSRQITPVTTNEHSSYYSSRGPPPEHGYWPPSESDYPRNSHDPPPSHMHHYRGGPPPRHSPHAPHYSHPPPQYHSHPNEPGWSEGTNESPPALVDRAPSFDGHENEPHYPYYPSQGPPPYDAPYDRSGRGPPHQAQPPHMWKEYHSSQGNTAPQKPAPPPNMPPSPWGPSRNDAGSMGTGGPAEHTPPPTPPNHMYPPPRWSHDFGRHHPNYPPPPGPHGMNNMEPSRLLPPGGESSYSTPPRPNSYADHSPGPRQMGPYPPPHQSHNYHHSRHPPSHPPPHSQHPLHRTDSNKSTPPSNSSMYAPYTYVQQPHMEEKTILRKKFSWKHYPELERFLIANRDEYLRHSSMNYTAEQKQYNNWLTDRLLEVAEENHYAFDPDDFNFVSIRDRIRCYYKSYVQTARKRGLSLPTKEGGSNKAQKTTATGGPSENSNSNIKSNDQANTNSEDGNNTSASKSP